MTSSRTAFLAAPEEENKTKRKSSQLIASFFIDEVQKMAKNRKESMTTKAQYKKPTVISSFSKLVEDEDRKSTNGLEQETNPRKSFRHGVRSYTMLRDLDSAT